MILKCASLYAKLNQSIIALLIVTNKDNFARYHSYITGSG